MHQSEKELRRDARAIDLLLEQVKFIHQDKNKHYRSREAAGTLIIYVEKLRKVNELELESAVVVRRRDTAVALLGKIVNRLGQSRRANRAEQDSLPWISKAIKNEFDKERATKSRQIGEIRNKTAGAESQIRECLSQLGLQTDVLLLKLFPMPKTAAAPSKPKPGKNLAIRSRYEPRSESNRVLREALLVLGLDANIWRVVDWIDENCASAIEALTGEAFRERLALAQILRDPAAKRNFETRLSKMRTNLRNQDNWN